MTNFADYLISRMLKNKSVLTAGIDPQLDALPSFICEKAARESHDNHTYVYKVLTDSFIPSLEAISGLVCACKPNIAFFEQYGLAGLSAYRDILIAARRLKIPIIIDAKRGDIGSTAQAYAAAFLSGVTIQGERNVAFEADALTVNPYLGADTLEVFAEACQAYGKGIFVLVRTSNPGSDWLQGVADQTGSVAERVACWVAERGESLVGDAGVSSIGAVLGATYPEQARSLRALMPKNLFLIPGFGAQGGAAQDAVAGFANEKAECGAATVNVSRGLFSVFSQSHVTIDEMQQALISKAKSLNLELNSALSPDSYL